ncbi:MAG: hypothetical protein ABI863_21575 [Ginsengibacter sp.]
MFLLITGLCSPAQNTALREFNTALLVKNKLNSSVSLIHFTSPVSTVINLQNVKQIVPADFYTCNIGFFCKKELLIEKTTKIPLRFRLGSLQQCNYYEGKKQ